MIRERYKILGQVKALTAEGRLSGIVLIALPIGLFLMLLYMKPDYVDLNCGRTRWGSRCRSAPS